MGEIKSSTYGHAREILAKIAIEIFLPLMASIAKEHSRLLIAGEIEYAKVRKQYDPELIKIIEHLCTPNISLDEMRDHVQQHQIHLQVFLRDRFEYADKYLSKFGELEFFLDSANSNFLRWCLIDIWDNQPHTEL